MLDSVPRGAGRAIVRTGSGAACSSCRRCSRCRTCSAATRASSRDAADFDRPRCSSGSRCPRHARRLLRPPDQLVDRVRCRARFPRRRRVIRHRPGGAGVYMGPRRCSGLGGRPGSSSSPPPRCAWHASTSRPRRPARPTSAISSGCRAPRPPRVIASTVYIYPYGLETARPRSRARRWSRPGVPDGQHDPLPQLQGDRRRPPPIPTLVLFLGAVGLALIASTLASHSSCCPTAT